MDHRTSNLCAALGPALENLRHTDAELYASYISQTLSAEEEEARQRSEASPDATREEKPVETSVLLRIAAAQGFQGWGVGEGGEYAEGDEQRGSEDGGLRIRCWAAETRGSEGEADAERWTVYEVSWVTLVVLQIVVGLVVVACAAEGVVLVWGWYVSSSSFPLLSFQYANPPPRLSRSCTTPETPLLTTTFTRPAPLRLDGDEKRLLATPAQHQHPDRPLFLRSPGIEKKLRAYSAPDYDRSTARWQLRHGEDDDDECDGPVM